MGDNNKEVWLATKLWTKELDYKKFVLSFVKPTVKELKKSKLIECWYFLFERGHINFMIRLDEKTENRDEIIENMIKPIIYKNIEKIKDFMDENESPNPKHPPYSGEADTYGREGWVIVQKFFEYSSEFALCNTDQNKDIGEGFNENKLIHCFLNSLGYSYYQEPLYHLDSFFGRIMSITNNSELDNTLKQRIEGIYRERLKEWENKKIKII